MRGKEIRKEQKREINAIMIDTIIKSKMWVKDILLLHFDVAKPVMNTRIRCDELV